MQGLYAIVDVPHRFGLSVAEATRAVLGDRLGGGDHGASVVQLRAKEASTAQRVAWAREMVPLCRDAGVTSIVDDDVSAAIESGADGVHLGQDDPGADDVAGVRAKAAAAGRERFVVGLSTHSLGQLREAGRQRPDYLALGPIAPTRSKANPDPVVGFPALLDACRVASAPLVAIGGLDEPSGRRAMECGAAAIAVIGALALDGRDRIRARAIELSVALTEASAPLELSEVHRRIPVLPPEQLAELAHWGDSLGVHLGLGLPARFAPRVENGRPLYRPCDVLDLIEALGKHPAETWDQWRRRAVEDDGAPLVQLRRQQ